MCTQLIEESVHHRASVERQLMTLLGASVALVLAAPSIRKQKSLKDPILLSN